MIYWIAAIIAVLCLAVCVWTGVRKDL